MTTAAESDEALYERWARGDLAAFDRLYARFERPLFGFIRAQIRGDSAAEAEDLLHEAFLAVLRARGGGGARELRSFRAWRFEVARNLCRNRLRSRQRADRAIAATTAVEATETATTAVSAEQRLAAGERAAVLERAVERLPVPLAELYRLRAAGLSYDEVAAVLEVPLGTVKSRMHEMVRRLRGEVLS